jgi:hydrophobic/amphiphilic exporter-1 (mainly G- bacteria), HAE1 family
VTRLSIRRPVAVAMVYASVALLGVAAWRNIPVEHMPDASFPRLTLRVDWSGASPETMEARVTSPIESAVQQVKGVENITSSTYEGRADIIVSFAREVDMDFVRMELSERMAGLEDDLPAGVSTISITPYVPATIEDQATSPLLEYVFTGPLVMEALRLHLDEVVVPEILQIRGVSDVEISGGQERVLEIELDPDRLAALGLTLMHASQAVARLDLLRNVGGVRQGDREWSVTVRNRPESVREIREASLPLPGGRSASTPVRLMDIASIHDVFEEPTSYYRIGRGPAVNVRVHRDRGSNAVRLAEAVQARLAEIEQLNPPGASFELIRNQAELINREFTDLRNRAAVAAGVIFLVLLLFLRSFRTAGVVFATIAFSILISLNLIYFGGLSLNLMTLMGLALGFGLIVDNSIVVLENVYRKWEQGSDPVSASEQGAREVVLPILAATLTTLIVFLPFLYFQGELRVIYLPLVAVVAMTLAASIFVAFTFIPALTARVLGKGRGPGAGRALPGRESPPPGLRLPLYTRFYSGLLAYSLRFPWATVAVAAICLAASWAVFDKNVPRGRLFGGGGGIARSWVDVQVSMPRGSDLARMDELIRFFEDRLALMPEVERFESRVTAMRGTIRVDFPEELEFTAIPLAIEERLRDFSLGFTGADVRVLGQGPAFYGGPASAPPSVRITVLGYNYEHLGQIAEDLGRRLSQHSRVQEVNTNATGMGRERQSEFVAEVNREATDRHQLTVGEVAGLVQSLIRGASGVRQSIVVGGDPLRYEVKLAGYRLSDVDALRETVVTTSRGARVPLGELVNVREREVLFQIRRENQQYERTVAYEFRGPAALSDAIRDAAIAATVLPPGYAFRVSQAGTITDQESRQINLVLFVSIGLVFMVTAGLFESVRQPLCVLLAVPMALIGVFLIFFFVRATFTREAYIGMIMMGGIVVNNAILLVDHINRIRSESSGPLVDAIVRGTLDRVRPILMTTSTTVLGLLPLVMFMPASDARIWNAFTYSLIGGLLSSTLFVLTTTPALYLLFERPSALERGGETLHGPYEPEATSSRLGGK